MKTLRTRLAVLAPLPLLLALAPSADELGFHPAKDTKSQKKLSIEAEFRVEDASFTMNGEPMPGEILDELKSQTLLMNLGVGVTETFKGSSGGRPTELLRSYDDLSLSMEVGDESQDVEEAKEFQGKTVRFVWNEEEKAYDKSFHESQGDEDALKELIDDMEVRCLLPDKKVSEGDTWSVDVAHLEPLFFPGGMPMAGKDEDAAGFEDVAEEIGNQIEEALKDFKVDCTYKGTREVDGVRVGEVAFTYRGKCTVDLAPVLEKIRDAEGDAEMPDMDFDASAGMEMEGEGTLHWDLAAGVLHGYTMSAKVKFDVSVDVHAEQGGQSMEMSMSGALGGDVTWEMSRQ